jgi:hypothetical protein
MLSAVSWESLCASSDLGFLNLLDSPKIAFAGFSVGDPGYGLLN